MNRDLFSVQVTSTGKGKGDGTVVAETLLITLLENNKADVCLVLEFLYLQFNMCLIGSIGITQIYIFFI